jgi:hypothetical protein
VLLPESLDDYVADTNPVHVVNVFVDELDLGQVGFECSGLIILDTPEGRYPAALQAFNDRCSFSTVLIPVAPVGSHQP